MQIFSHKLWDLGLGPESMFEEKDVKNKIKQLDEEFDQDRDTEAGDLNSSSVVGHPASHPTQEELLCSKKRRMRMF